MKYNIRLCTEFNYNSLLVFIYLYHRLVYLLSSKYCLEVSTFRNFETALSLLLTSNQCSISRMVVSVSDLLLIRVTSFLKKKRGFGLFSGRILISVPWRDINQQKLNLQIRLFALASCMRSHVCRPCMRSDDPLSIYGEKTR